MTRPAFRTCTAVLLSLLSGAAAWAQVSPRPPAAPSPKAQPADTVPQPAPLVVNRIAAVVNNEPILLSNVADRVIRMTDPRAQLDSAALDTLEKTALQDLIDDELLIQKAKAEKVEVSDADVASAADAEIKEVRARFGTDAEFAAVVKENGFGSVDEYRRNRQESARREMLKRDLIAKFKHDGKISSVNVSEADVTAEFERGKATFPKKLATVGFRQIVFPITPSEASKQRARAKIDSLRKELEAHPQDFESIAKRESMDLANKELGGDLGWNRRGIMTPAFDRVMFALNPGVISPVVETVYGYHIIRVDRVQPAEVKARHILIKFSVDSSDEARATKLADSVAGAWRAGASYDSLAARFHDEANGEQRSISEFARDSLPVSYQTAIADHKVGDVVGPFGVADPSIKLSKPIVLQLTKMDAAGDYTIDELRQRIRASLTDYRSMRRFLDTLKSESFVWVYDTGNSKPASTKGAHD